MDGAGEDEVGNMTTGTKVKGGRSDTCALMSRCLSGFRLSLPGLFPCTVHTVQ